MEDLGEVELKNISRPVQVYRVHVASDHEQDAESAPLPLPSKPSIAVLPFDNMSGDPEQEYFSDGISEDIITDLSKISGLFVIAGNSSFFYKHVFAGSSIQPSSSSMKWANDLAAYAPA